MNVRLKLACCLVAVTIMQGFADQDTAANAEDKTLSPYFLVEGEGTDLERFPLKTTHVDVSIAGVLAYVKVTQTYSNDGEQPINAQYVFPASTRAAVHGMKMTIGEDVITARIEEREAASKEFDEAKEAGKSASLLEQQRPNVFAMDIANIMPGDTIEIELRYTELLVPTDGTYEFVYPTVVGPRYSELTENTATDHDRWIESPYLHEGKDTPTRFTIDVRLSTGIPISALSCTSHDTEVEWEAKNAASIWLAPSETSGGNRDFVLEYRLMDKQVQSGLMLYRGEDENFFLLLAQPPERIVPESIPPREYIFVVDVSGSMNGFPLTVSKKLLKSLIGNLRANDRFNVILFAGGSHAMAGESIPATEENTDRAIEVIDNQHGGGGTRLLAALKHAVSLPHPDFMSRSIVVVTDGYIAAERDAFDFIANNLNNANVFAFGIGSSVNRYLVEGLARAGQGEPFIVTDRSRADEKARQLKEYIESPILTDVSVEYEGFEPYDLEPTSIPDLMAKRPLQILGKWRGEPGGTITVRGKSGQGEYEQVFVVNEDQPHEDNSPLRYLWARTRIASLSDYNFGGLDDETVREITSLGLTYELLTDYTSFIAVHEVVRNTNSSATDVKQPLPLPEGVSDLAVGGASPGPRASTPAMSRPGKNVPEPELMWLLLLVAIPLLVVFGFRDRLRKEK